MATRSRIGYVSESGKIVSAYCHWDGYPSHNGKILLEHFNEMEKVKALVAGGDMSILAPSIEKPNGHTFDSPVDGHVVYYGRDRGETDVGSREDADESEFLNNGEEYNYLFNKGKWFVAGHGSLLCRLTKALIKKDGS